MRDSAIRYSGFKFFCESAGKPKGTQNKYRTVWRGSDFKTYCPGVSVDRTISLLSFPGFGHFSIRRTLEPTQLGP